MLPLPFFFCPFASTHCGRCKLPLSVSYVLRVFEIYQCTYSQIRPILKFLFHAVHLEPECPSLYFASLTANAGDCTSCTSRIHILEATTKMSTYISPNPCFTRTHQPQKTDACLLALLHPLLRLLFLTKCLLAVPLTPLIQEGSKCPTVTTGDISIEVMHNFEKVAQKFFNHKDIGDDKQVSKILDCFNDHRIADWVEEDHDQLINMTFPIFMAEIHRLYLPQYTWRQSLTPRSHPLRAP